jgi:hypothetical protein
LYAVHRAESFRTWVKTRCPWLILIYIPGGMTPILQVMDLTVNFVFKKAIRALFEVHLHACVQQQRQEGKAWNEVTFDLGMKTIRQAVYQWMSHEGFIS